MKEKIKQILNFIKFDQNLLEQRLFWVIVSIGTIVTFVSAVITIIEKLGSLSCLTSIACLAFMITIMIFAYKKNAYHKCYIAMCYFLNCILLPLNFYTCGGIDSGMILYYLVSIFLCVPCLKGKSRIITFIISLIMLEGTVIVSMIFPDAANSITRQQSYNDMIITFIITSCCLFAFSSAIINSYEHERNKRELLLKQLEIISKRDALTGLYNRRVLFEFLENNVAKNKQLYHIAMFDIDNFKLINDTYGHVFGDKVLSEISSEISCVVLHDKDEIAARYGGEEFVYLIKDESASNAYERIEKIRKNIATHPWEEHENLNITISGGFISCKKYDDIMQMLSEADKLLYVAKGNGKNQIANDFSNKLESCLQTI